MEAVSCRLLLASTVPDVIATLRMMYGRPEIIIHSLLLKIKGEPTPKLERLESIITFALSVQNLCSTIEASGLTAHLYNPSLLQELVEKLPSQIKLNWAVYRQNILDVNLATFSKWFFQLAEAASSVTMPVIGSSSYESKPASRNSKEKQYLNQHSTPEERREKIDVSSSRPTKECPVCCKNHFADECDRFAKLTRSEKWKIVNDAKLCKRCLGPHSWYRCKSDKKCTRPNCTAKHHPFLHNDDINGAGEPSTACNAHQNPHQSILFRIVPVTLYNKDIAINTFAFLDEGSSITLLEEDIANELELEGTHDSLCLRWTGGTVREEKESRRVSLNISGQRSVTTKYRISDVRTVKSLNLPKQSLNTKDIGSQYGHLKNLPIDPYKNAIPRILIGIDNWKLGLPVEVKEGKWREHA